MGNSYVIRLWLISIVLCYMSVSCQDIEPVTLEPELPVDTVTTVATTTTDIIAEISTTTVEPAITTESTSVVTTETTTAGAGSTTDDNTAESIETTSERTEKATTKTATTEKDLAPTTKKPPCPQPSCYYKLTQTRILWFFTKTCCLQCCYLKDLPYQKCRFVHLGICGYPAGKGYPLYDDDGDYDDSNYSVY